MLRFMLSLSLALLISLTGIGLVIAHQWGWSEYASPELYVVYYQAKRERPYGFFMVDAAGSGGSWSLTTHSVTLTTLNCSPDGRTLAFLTDDAHLYVVNQSGLVYERVLDQRRTVLNVANNGMVALSDLSQVRQGGSVLLDARQTLALVPPDGSSYESVEPSSLGTAIWNRADYSGVHITTLSGEMIATFPRVDVPKWFASEQILTYDDIGALPAERVLADPSTRKLIRLNSALMRGVFSPDGTRRATNMIEPGSANVQIIVTDALSTDHSEQLTHSSGVIYVPICFLTFRPTMLISGS
ncbi:MAG: hypothetical protein ABI700_04375 [Chloroflexota bacterium]